MSYKTDLRIFISREFHNIINAATKNNANLF